MTYVEMLGGLTGLDLAAMVADTAPSTKIIVYPGGAWIRISCEANASCKAVQS